MSNKLIAIWGSPASGKTITTLKLAQTLGAKNKNVLTIFSDPLCPSIPFLVPQIANKQQSLGELLSLPALAQDDLLRFSLSIKSSPRLGLLSYSKGDHAFSYANYDRERAVDFLTLARHIADVVLVDCTSYVSSSLLSTVALELADNVFRFHTCDLKSMMFYASNLPLLSDARFQQAPLFRFYPTFGPDRTAVRTVRLSAVFGLSFRISIPWSSKHSKPVCWKHCRPARKRLPTNKALLK